MVSTNLKIISELKSVLLLATNDRSIKSLFTSRASDFSRDRHLTLPRLVSLIINMPKRSLSVEINDFFSYLQAGSVTKSAFSIQRSKLLPLFFEVWNQFLVDCFYHYYGEKVKRWKGHRLLAGDGSTINLINKPDVLHYFGSQTNQHGQRAMARTFQLYDVLNDISLFGKISPMHLSEKRLLLNSISKLTTNDVLLLDRGFPGYELMYLLEHQESAVNFVIRAKNNFNIPARQFLKSSKSSKIIKLTPDPRAILALREQGFIVKKNTQLKIRMLKVALPSGQIELLFTSLYDKDRYSNQDLYTLYGLRWGIETSFNTQKNQLQLEQFSGHRVVCILQDFYAHMFVLNLQGLISKQCQPALDNINLNRKYRYKLNRNVSWGSLKNRIISLFLQSNEVDVLKQLQALFIKNIEAIRPNRANPRLKKEKFMKEKFRTSTNFKRAI